MGRGTTHEFVCIQCNLTFKGRIRRNGKIVASNGAPSGYIKTALCDVCISENANYLGVTPAAITDYITDSERASDRLQYSTDEVDTSARDDSNDSHL